MQTDCDVLIAGNGLAALTLALSLPESFRIVILCKNRLDDTASRHAQGGIAAAWSGEDDIGKHVADTLEAGAGLCDEAAVRTILSQGKPAIEWLLAQGVAFDRNHNDLHLTREGGHTCRRIAHVADYTGEAVMQSLIIQIRRRPNIRVYERQMALDVQTESGAACGLTVLDCRTQETYRIRARHTVLAGGGLGQIYAATTTPPECTGDAIAMAIRAGCAIENLEFIQFHPTGLARPSENGRTFLISEAVRGEGGILTNQSGERFAALRPPRRTRAARHRCPRHRRRNRQTNARLRLARHQPPTRSVRPSAFPVHPSALPVPMRLGHHAPSHPRPPRATLHLRRHPNRPQRQNLPAAALRLRRNRLYRTARSQPPRQQLPARMRRYRQACRPRHRGRTSVPNRTIPKAV